MHLRRRTRNAAVIFGAIGIIAGCVDSPESPPLQPARIAFVGPSGPMQSLEVDAGSSITCLLDVRHAGGAPVVPRPFVVLATTGTGVTVDAACKITSYAPGTAILTATTTVDGSVVRDSLIIHSIGFATLDDRRP